MNKTRLTLFDADVAIIDLSIQNQQCSLFYHIGIRENFGISQNILLYNEQSRASFSSLLSSFPNPFPYISYKLNTDGSTQVLESSHGVDGGKATIIPKLKQCFLDMTEVQK